MKENVLVFGSSGHASVIISMIEDEKKFNIVGIIDPNKSILNFMGKYPILGKEADLSKICFDYNVNKGIIAIGNNKIRSSIYNEVVTIKEDFEFVTIIHPSAYIANNVSLGFGTVVMPGAIINANSKIGKFTIVNTKASLDHDSTLGHFSSLAPGVVTGGNVVIGDYSSISIGAILKNNITIGKNAVVGAGSLVLKDVTDNAIVYGTPAQFIRLNHN